MSTLSAIIQIWEDLLLRTALQTSQRWPISRVGCGLPVKRCAFLQFCGIMLCETMNNLKSKAEMMIASLRDEVSKHKCVSSLFYHPLCSYILSPTVLEAPGLPTLCTFVCMHASKCVIMQVSELCFLTPCCRFLFFFASLFLSLDPCCCISI